MATLIARPQPGGGGANVTVDGILLRSGVDEAWATLIAGAGTSARTGGFGTGQDFPVYWTGTATAGQWSSMARYIATFDLASIAGATVSAVKFWIMPETKADPASVAPNLNVYNATPAADNDLAAADYGQCGGASPTAYCDTPITYANFNVATPAFQSFTFNAAGIAAVQAAVDAATKIFRLSLRNANYDVAATAPTKSTDNTNLTIETADYTGTDKDPYLEITYTLPGKFFLLFKHF